MSEFSVMEADSDSNSALALALPASMKHTTSDKNAIRRISGLDKRKC